MADRKEGKGPGRAPLRKKEKKAEAKAANAPEPEKGKEKGKAKEAEKGKEKERTEEQQPVPVPVPAEGEKPGENGATPDGAAATAEDGEFQFQPMELPPFEIIEGERIDPFFFKFQFKNVEYSSGRNKTFLCYLVDAQAGAGEIRRGYLEDEHSGTHAEEAFFHLVLPEYDPAKQYAVTWYVSSSPCPACAVKLAEVLRARKTLRLTIFSSRIFMWEEPEAQAGMKALADAGCKLRMMKPTDFTYTWDTFVEHEDQKFEPWEDCKENYEYYQEKLADFLQ